MKYIGLFLAGLVVGGVAATSEASLVLGTGTGALVGNDLTDLGDDGSGGSYSPPNLAGFDAVFFANSEPNFDPPNNEGAFNVFDNSVGGGQNKWCCGDTNVMPPNGPGMIVGADFSTTLAEGIAGIQLTSFTLTSGNDSANRDPDVWRIEGSNDTTDGLDGTWTTIYEDDTVGTVPWTARNQVIQFSPADGDTFLTSEAFDAFRLVVSDVRGDVSGAFFQLNELELFGAVRVPEPCSIALGGLGFLMVFGYARPRRRSSRQ